MPITPSSSNTPVSSPPEDTNPQTTDTNGLCQAMRELALNQPVQTAVPDTQNLLFDLLDHPGEGVFLKILAAIKDSRDFVKLTKATSKTLIQRLQPLGEVAQENTALKELANNGFDLRKCSEQTRDTPRAFLLAIQKAKDKLVTALKRGMVPPILLREMVSFHNETFQAASHRVRDNEATMRAAVHDYPEVFKCASDRLKNDFGFAKYAIDIEPTLLLQVSDDLKNCDELVLAALEKDKYLLSQLDDKFKDNEALVRAAIEVCHEYGYPVMLTQNSTPTRLNLTHFASARLLDNKEFAKFAVHKVTSAHMATFLPNFQPVFENPISHFSARLQNDPELIAEAFLAVCAASKAARALIQSQPAQQAGPSTQTP